MHPYLFLLLLSSGVSCYFLPLEQTPHPQNETKSTLIREMLCLLEAEDETINEKFLKPLHIQNRSCAHNNTEIFIRELKKIPKWKCVRRVEKGMQRLEKICHILKKSPSKDKRCSQLAKTSFPRFKESLEEFLRWVNQELDCSDVGTSEWGSYLDGKCTCRDPGTAQRASGWGGAGAGWEGEGWLSQSRINAN